VRFQAKAIYCNGIRNKNPSFPKINFAILALPQFGAFKSLRTLNWGIQITIKQFTKKQAHKQKQLTETHGDFLNRNEI